MTFNLKSTLVFPLFSDIYALTSFLFVSFLRPVACLNFFFFFLVFIYLAVLGLSCDMQDLSLWGADSLVVVHRLQRAQAQ